MKWSRAGKTVCVRCCLNWKWLKSDFPRSLAEKGRGSVPVPILAPQQHPPAAAWAGKRSSSHLPRLPAALSFQSLSLGRVLCECRFPLQLTRPTQCCEISSSCHTFLGATDWCPHSFRTPTTSPCAVPVHKAVCGTFDTRWDALDFCFSFP